MIRLNPQLRASYCALCILLLPLSLAASTNAGQVSGKILDPRGVAVAGAHLKLLNSAGEVIREAKSDDQGSFILDGVEPGEYQLRAEEPTFVSVILGVSVARGHQEQVAVQFHQLVSVSQAISVVASAPSLLTPDPAQSIVIHDQVLDANPGRPGAPISIPGLPIETASGGIKAPQYFAPGVAGDHGEPIAQFFEIGNFLYPNNLPANAHGKIIWGQPRSKRAFFYRTRTITADSWMTTRADSVFIICATASRHFSSGSEPIQRPCKLCFATATSN